MKNRILIPVLFILCLLLCACSSAPITLPGENFSREEIRENGITQRHFIIESEGFSLNAVYTYVSDGKHHPTVLLIAGSGPADCDSTVGAWKPLEDIALGLAAQGVNSLRLDKRTLNGADRLRPTDGVAEEYVTDCLAALACLRSAGIEDVYLLGHSLGGQIAAELAANTPGIRGMILFHSTPRHLADVACDQYTRADPSNAAAYRFYADAAKSATEETAKGYYYYGAPDYYWVTYNGLDTVAAIRKASIPTLIINSTADGQMFQADLAAWKPLADDQDVTVLLNDGINHFGYCADTSDPTVLDREYPFSQTLIDQFADFCKESS